MITKYSMDTILSIFLAILDGKTAVDAGKDTGMGHLYAKALFDRTRRILLHFAAVTDLENKQDIFRCPSSIPEMRKQKEMWIHTVELFKGSELYQLRKKRIEHYSTDSTTRPRGNYDKHKK